MGWFSERAAVARAILDRKWVKIALGLWTFVASYDLLISQILPERWADKAPKVRDLVAETSGWLPLWGWLLVLAAIVVAATFEYSVRKMRRVHFGDAVDLKSEVTKPRQPAKVAPPPLPQATMPIAEQRLVSPEPAKPPSRPYHTRAEIDGMLTSLVGLQRLFKSMVGTNEAVQKMTRGTNVEFLSAPVLSDFPQIADGLEQYAEQLKNDNAEVERLIKDTDEFVGSAAPVKYPPRLGPDPFYSFHKIVSEAAEELRRTTGRTTDKGLAALAIRAKQQELFKRYEKYTASIHEAQTKISEKIADLRSR
jgi:hypothetical protein